MGGGREREMDVSFSIDYVVGMLFVFQRKVYTSG